MANGCTGMQNSHNYNAATMTVQYDAVIAKWQADERNAKYPVLLPMPGDLGPFRFRFFELVYGILDRKPTCMEDHVDVIFASQRAIEFLIEWEIPAAKGDNFANEVELEANDSLCREVMGPNWGPHNFHQGTAPLPGQSALARLQSVVGQQVVIETTTYTIAACLTTTEDFDPVYVLHAADGLGKKYIPLDELRPLLPEFDID
ncbi:hypothetical protein PUNSTDRAFT_145265 [Punctularia strigosozonata HHB-11173 SS5]|uniref:uncharacterized protein n=1 Tax=Punctularia strigosozonata (strain HHB-11173) TaxID=741275 RepID=UPI000441636D|nr:uncharacterized protein PUNSTDRAFT_145265 [Punctularia strigosozonata HHB-11173 SS5]EIN06773.1 hypothetical protein PUNSTDRAFT_145265 [Punctularia strigosozonata HHB-11173 SS5]